MKKEIQVFKQDFVHTQFGDKRPDPYYWMREKDSSKVLDYLKSENEYAKEYLEETSSLREKLFTEMKARVPLNYDSAPMKWGDYEYYHSWLKGKEYPFYKRKGDKEEILLDVNEMALNKKYCDVESVWVSPNHQILAYALDDEGREFFSIHFKDLKTQKTLLHFIPKATSDFVWANDNETLFYVQQDLETLRPFQVFRFHIPTGKNELVWEEKDEKFFVSLNKSLSESYIFLGSSSTQTSEWWILDANKPEEGFQLFSKRIQDHKYFLDHGGDAFYILTNKDQSFNFKLMEAKDSSSPWEEVIPHREDRLLEDFSVFEKFIAIEVREKALTNIVIWDREASKEHNISFSESVYSCEIGSNAEYKTESVRVNFNSPIRSNTIYDYHVKKRELVFCKQTPVLGGFSADDYLCQREIVQARDGAEVPITLVYKKTTQLNSSTPLLLYGYGSYGLSMDPNFRSSLFSLLDRGFVYVIAHIRGGSEKGKKWYYNGRLLKKKNTFTDFIDCAEHLIQKKYTSASHLYAMGGSAGGLLMGAVLNDRPDLFHGAIALVPFVDVLTTMLDDKIPLSTAEYEEWGNPNEKEYYDYMKSYSPYDNVKKTNYPHLLVKTGYHDPRVQYWEPAKWVARLREFKTNDNKIYFITDMESGHFGPTGRFQGLKRQALEFAFLLFLEKNDAV